MAELRCVVRRPARGEHDGANRLGGGSPVPVLRQLHLELAGHARGLRDARVELDLDAGLGLDRRDQRADLIRFGLAIGCVVRNELGQVQRVAAELARLLDQQHGIAALRRLARGREARQAAAHNQDALVERPLGVRHRHGDLARLGDGHADIVRRRHLRVVLAGGLRPGHLLAQVRAHHLHAVEAELVLVHARRARGDHGLIHRARGRVVANEVEALLRRRGNRASCRTAP